MIPYWMKDLFEEVTHGNIQQDQFELADSEMDRLIAAIQEDTIWVTTDPKWANLEALQCVNSNPAYYQGFSKRHEN